MGVKSPDESIDYLNILIYGEPGAGKTYLAATAMDEEETSPALFVDIEGGTKTVRKRRNLDVVQVRTMSQIETIHNDLVKDTSGYYKTVILDTLTELQQLDMRTVMKEQYNKKPDTTDLYVPSQREWGKSGERVRMIIRAFRDLPLNTIVTAQLATAENETGGMKVYPSLPGKLRSDIPGFFDIVGYLRAVTVRDGKETSIERHLQTVQSDKVSAKDRTDALGGLVKNPSIPLLWSLIQDSQDET